MSQKIVSSAAASYFGRVARQMNVSSKIVSPVKVTGVIPGGFPHNAFNGGGNVRPESMLNMVETCRGNMFFVGVTNSQTFPFDADKLYNENHSQFISAATTEVDEKLYDYNVVKAPLLFEAELDFIGRRSSQLKTSFYLENSSNPLIVSRVSSVFIDNKTRLPTSPPDWWVEKYKSCIEDEHGTNSIGRLEFDDGDTTQATECRVPILHSDSDGYGHTNWMHYIRHCHNAFGHHQATKQGKQKGLHQYFLRGIRCFSIHFKNESSAGDVLTVTTTPSDSHDADSVFYFRVENESKSVVCQSKIEYYPLKA